MDRAPAQGESWVSPLGPPRPNGPLVAPVFIDGHDEDTAPDAGPLTTEHEPTHAHDAGEASDAGGVDGETADDGPLQRFVRKWATSHQ
jgi:hypothetical protein